MSDPHADGQVSELHELPKADDLAAEYRRSRGWPAEPGPTSRISVELPRSLVRRLNRQARLMETPRRQIIEAAIEGLVREFEEIDAR